MIESLSMPAMVAGARPTTPDSRIGDIAEKLEATFIAEMLKHARFGETPEVMGGGAGEDQFASFLRQAQADEMARAGGIGLAENLVAALSRSLDAMHP